MMPARPSRLSVTLLLIAGLLASLPALAQRSARDTFDAELARLGQADRQGQWSQWQYESAALSPAAGLDFDLAWGYVDAAAASEGDVFVAVLRNHSRHDYCVRPRVNFKGEVSRVQTVGASVVVPAGESLTVAMLRIARRTEVEHDINAAYWPAPAGNGPARCSAREPAGLDAWLGEKGEAPFPGNRTHPVAPAG